MKIPKKYSFLISKIFYNLKFENYFVTKISAKNFFCDIFLAEKVFGDLQPSGINFSTHTHNFFEIFQ
jgi:hypothetical protein